MEKVIRDGKLAVIYHNDWGAGWSTWSGAPVQNVLLHHPELVSRIEHKIAIDQELIDRLVDDSSYVCMEGVDSLSIKWVPLGRLYRVKEYDGAETVEIFDPNDWKKAE